VRPGPELLAGARDLPAAPPPAARRSALSILGRILLHALFLAIAAVAYAAHEHFKLNGESTPSTVSLVAAGGFGFAPLRLIVHELLAVEGKVVHALHGLGGLVLIGLTATGAISGGPLLTHSAMAPFAIMGAAQAIMHQDHPRTREQAEALRTFATSLPEVAQFAGSRDLGSPANIRRAVLVLTDLLGKAQTLGETELRSDPGFQAALRRTTTLFGVSLGLDAADRAIGKLGASPAGARDVPELRRRLAAARRSIGAGSSPEPTGARAPASHG
jgi:hypothetical protein